MLKLLQQWRDEYAFRRTDQESVPDEELEKAIAEARLINGDGEPCDGQPRFSWRHHPGILGAKRLYARIKDMETK